MTTIRSEARLQQSLAEVSRALESGDRQALESIQYEEAQIGHHMTREWVMVAETSTIHQAIEELRRLGELPPQTDRIFVVDARHVFRGSVPLPTLLVKDPASPIIGAVAQDTVTCEPTEHVHQAVKAFERYDLVSAPVVDDRGKLVGRLTVDTVANRRAGLAS